MEKLLFWIYLINAIILIIHEIDSAYWQEWKLLDTKDENGINGFLLLHIPMLFAILFGLVLVDRALFSGLVLSFILCAGGIFAFFFHFYHIRKGKPEFNTMLSKTIIISTFLISIIQLFLTLLIILK